MLRDSLDPETRRLSGRSDKWSFTCICDIWICGRVGRVWIGRSYRAVGRGYGDGVNGCRAVGTVCDGRVAGGNGVCDGCVNRRPCRKHSGNARKS
jgi:hypothetical protein